MARPDQQIEAIDQAIIDLTKKLVDAGPGSSAFRSVSTALKELAEARAWLVSPGQPHGGSTTITSSS